MNKIFSIKENKLQKILQVYYFDTFDESCQQAFLQLQQQKVLGWDSETTYAEEWKGHKQAGLDPYRSRLRLSQFATEDGEVFIFDNFKLPKEAILQKKLLLEKELPVKVAHNSKFDIKMARQHLGVRRMGRLFDTDIGYRLTRCGQYVAGRTGLSELTSLLLGFKLDKELQISDWSANELEEEQLKYSAIDAYVVLPLRQEIIKAINELDLRYAAKIDFESIDPVSSLELTGFPLCPEKWIKVDEEMRAKRFNIMDQIAQEFLEKGVIKQEPLFTGAPICSKKARTGARRKTLTNSLTSSKQMANYLKAYGIKLPKKKDRKTQKISETTGTPSLKPLRNKYKIIPLLMEFRELDKRKTSYGSVYVEKYINPVTGFIHADFDPQGALTARFTCNKPNLQQIPAIPEYRSCFVAPKGWTFVGGDFSQIELRIAAELSGDSGFIAAFISGEDFHAKTAELMFGVKPGTSEAAKMRTYAKRINFGIIYGMGAGKLAMQTDLYESKDVYRLILLEEAGIIENADDWLEEKVLHEGYKRWEAFKISKGLSNSEIEKKVAVVETAQDYLKKYYETFPDLMDWLHTRGKEAADNERIRMETGRLVKFWVNQKDKVSRAQAERNGMNTPIQGLAGEILKIAIRKVFDEIYKAGLQDVVKLCHTVHDELQTLVRHEANQEYKIDLVNWTEKTLERCMVESGELFLKSVPCKVDIKSGQVWEK